MIDYAKKIKEYRERKFLTQTDLANLLGVSLASATAAGYTLGLAS